MKASRSSGLLICGREPIARMRLGEMNVSVIRDVNAKSRAAMISCS
jgi:hypothetical protein